MASKDQENLQDKLCLIAELTRLRWHVRVARDESMCHDRNYSTISRPSSCTAALTNQVDAISDQLGGVCYLARELVDHMNAEEADEAVAGVPLAIAYLVEYLPECPALLPNCVIRAIARLREVSK